MPNSTSKRYNTSIKKKIRTEDSSKIAVKENVDGHRQRFYEAPNIPFEGKWAFLLKSESGFTLVPLTSKVIFKQKIVTGEEEFDQDEAIKNTFLLMKNRKVKLRKPMLGKRKRPSNNKKRDDDSDKGKEGGFIPRFV